MTKGERLMLQDAIETALKAEISRRKLKAALIIVCIINGALLAALGGLTLWIAAC